MPTYDPRRPSSIGGNQAHKSGVFCSRLKPGNLVYQDIAQMGLSPDGARLTKSANGVKGGRVMAWLSQSPVSQKGNRGSASPRAGGLATMALMQRGRAV